MITYLQKSKFNKNSFLKLENPKGATHFHDGGGDIQLINNLPKQNKQDETPLELPTMNFNAGRQEEDGPLGLPSTL